MHNPLSQRIAVLDGLRAFAIGIVIFRHVLKPFWPDLSVPYIAIGPIDLGAFFINGWSGVDLFFVLSGFLIGSYLMARMDGNGWDGALLRNYAKRRFFRIAPVYYLVLTAIMFGLFPAYPFPANVPGDWGDYARHLAFMQDYYPGNFNIVFWSLAVEIKFYLLAPFLIWGLMRIQTTGRRMALLLLLIATQPLIRAFFAPQPEDFERYFYDVRVLFHNCLDGLLMGVGCAVLWRDEKTRNVLSRKRIANALFWTGLFVYLALVLPKPLLDYSVSDFGRTGLVTVISGCFAVMMLGLLGGAGAGHFFGWRGWKFPALISYSLYLIHLPMYFLSYALVARCLKLSEYDQYSGFWMVLPVTIVLSTALASVMYFYVERPIIGWSHGRRLQKENSGQTEKRQKADHIGDGG